MAWHLHNFQRRLIFTSLIKRHVYASVEFCSLVKTGCRLPCQCNCLRHKYQVATAAAATLFHSSTSNYLHAANEPRNNDTSPQSRGEIDARLLWEHQWISGRKCRNERRRREDIKAKRNLPTGVFQHQQQHSRRSRSLQSDRRETTLMCINNDRGVFAFPDHESTVDSQPQANKTKPKDETKDLDPPLVFVLDSKGKQAVLDLLTEHKQSSDHSAMDKLNHFLDVIQRESQHMLQDSKDITDWKTSRHKQETYCATKSTAYDDYLQAVRNNKHQPFHRHNHDRDIASRGSRYDRQHLQYCSVNLSNGKGGSPAPSSNKGRGEPSKEQLAVMYHRLYEQIPEFYSQSHDYTMYSTDVVFDNRILNVKTTGLPAYRATVTSMKYLSTACLYNVNLEVLNLTINTEMNCIQARWRVTGVPLHRLVLLPWRKDAKKYFDAFSTFDVGSDGLIHTHVMDKVMPNPGDKVAAPSLATRIGIALGIARPSSPAVQGNCTGNVNLAFMKPKWFFSKQQNI